MSLAALPWRYRARGPDRAAAARNFCDRRAAAGVAVRVAGEAFPTSTTVLDAATAKKLEVKSSPAGRLTSFS